MLGGSSSINGMVWIRGQAQDYDHWAQLGNRGWSFQDVLPLFKRMERFDGGSDKLRGRDGVLRITHTPRHKVPLCEKLIAAAEAMGLAYNEDHNGETQEGISMSQASIAGGRRQSTAYCYLDPVRSRSNLTITQGAMAGSLILEGKRCVGVRYTVGGVAQEARVSREVIVSGGSINSPKLLELSGIGRGEVLRAAGITVAHELNGVGENLRDHYSPRVKFAIKEKNLTFNDNANGWRLAREALKFAFFREGFLATTAVPVRMYFRTRPGLETPDATISILPFIYEMINRERLVSKRFKGITMNVNVLRSESTGSIHITSSDPSVPPAIRFNFLSTEHDRAGLLAAMRKGRELMATSPMKEITGEEIAPGAHVQSDDELLDWVRRTAETTYHPVGTCKMGNDAMAVVDSELRVHGIEGLRVADASIMPTLTSGNTNAPSIMIGEKCSDMVLAAAQARRAAA
jgi:choline dehydrogenase